jgi:putative membrane protein
MAYKFIQVKIKLNQPDMKKRPIRFLFAAFVSAALFSCGGQNKQEDTKEVAEEQNEEKFDDSDKEKDTDFAINAADGGMLEVELGKLAQTKATSAEVKKFAQMMVDDHSKANDELKALASQKNISLPASLSDKHQNKLKDLTEKTGDEFDKDYIDFMVEDHEEDIDAFEKQAENGTDAELKSWAAGKVTTLRHHLEMAKAAQETVKNAKK